MTRTLIFTTLAVLLANSPAPARCILSHCQSDTATSSRAYITNTHRQIVGDVNAPRGGQRIQIRDTSRRIIGYIEADGTITNRHRQPVANIEALR